ncbi:Alpha/Beta hydrolase protein [Talaromyces proteolyticus]|uniref:Alpha/Beta hydrolase protein n=1 Tax=Talaromyces proteolyticus TaxID=1131652 RepID=A0AAD4Q435_9EURO|nr:Alpha/Beta hydrolase protein [Talaromyces proteolyticus]KAH8702336.1 Alpha/Beta hydrolase protein [Talaromyces proteolyticus]
MPSRLPVAASSDNTPPPSLSAHQASNILVLLHGLGDTAAKFSSFGRALNLPETVCLTVQAPTPLPAGLVDQAAYHWGNDVIFDDAGGGLSMDAGFDRARQVIVRDVITETLIKKYGYKLRDILLVGFGQGGMAALDAARELGLHPPVEELPEATISPSSSSSTAESIGKPDYRTSLSGVVSFGGPYPLSASAVGPKDRTPVLLLAGRDDGKSEVSEMAVKRTKEAFEFVEVHRWSRRGDGMPRNREEMLPAMQFFARRLKSRKGVPAGSIELT